jgi:hypothetical protein
MIKIFISILGVLLLAIVILAQFPKESFIDKFNLIEIGMGRQDVKNILGEAKSKKLNVLPNQPFWGPQEAIDTSLINNKREYEEWIYGNDKNIYYIWFGDKQLKKDKWKVICSFMHEKGVVF